MQEVFYYYNFLSTKVRLRVIHGCDREDIAATPVSLIVIPAVVLTT